MSSALRESLFGDGGFWAEQAKFDRYVNDPHPYNEVKQKVVSTSISLGDDW